MRRVLIGLLLASAALMARADGFGAGMMDWNSFGVVAALAWGGLLLAFCVRGILSHKGRKEHKAFVSSVFFVAKKDIVIDFLLFAAIATVEAQKPTNNVPPNLNLPMGGGGVSLTGLGGGGAFAA